MAAILDFQVAPLADLTSSPQRTFVPNLVLVSQFARLVPLSAPLAVRLKHRHYAEVAVGDTNGEGTSRRAYIVDTADP